MKSEILTDHAIVRLAQRAIRPDAIELALAIGTEVEGGLLVTRKDCQELMRNLKRLMHLAERLSDTRSVLAGNRILTAYRASPRKQQDLLRTS